LREIGLSPSLFILGDVSNSLGKWKVDDIQGFIR